MKIAENRPTREWLLRYVLGELSQDETRKADELFFSDETFADSVEGTYRDLLDAYAAREVAGSEKDRIERAFFAEPHQACQQKILQAMRSRPKKPGRIMTHVSRPWFVSFWPVTVSVGALCFALALALYRYSERSQTPANRNAAVLAPGPTRLAAPSAAPPALTAQLYTILLMPGVNRGEVAVKSFDIPSSATEIVFQVVLPENQASRHFAVRLQGGREQAPLVFSSLDARTLGDKRYVEFRVPMTRISGEDYAVEVYDSQVAKRPAEYFVIRLARASAAHQ